MARVFECDYNDTDFPQGGSHPAGVAWDNSIDNDSPNGVGLFPAIGRLGRQGNFAQVIGGESCKISSLSSRRTGYKGHRFYLGDGQNNSNGGLNPETINVNSRELYFRWYLRTSLEWAGPEPHYWKLWRSFSAEDMDIGLGYGANVGGHQPWGIAIPSNDAGIGNQELESTMSWYSSQGNSLKGDGTWHCYEVHIVKNSNASTADGIIEWELDGVAAGSRSDASFVSGTSDWGAWFVSNQNSIANGPWPVDITDIAMDGSQRIGTLAAVPSGTSLSRSRVRNDNGSQTTATYRYAEDQFLVSNSDENFRLRIQIDDVVGSYKYRLEYKLSTDTAWSVVGTSGAIKLAASANIAAGGEATTAQLTAPSGKTTANFTAGRMWDDENGLDTITIASGEYTELEWCLQFSSGVTSPLQNYQFRVSRS